MVFGVVEDDDHATTGLGADAAKAAQKRPAGLGVKMALGFGAAKLAVAESDGTEVADAFTSGRVDEDRIPDLRGNPHTAPAPVLLEMDLIHRPEINAWVGGQFAEFFLPPPADAGRIGPLAVGVCGGETPTAERAAGIASPSVPPRAASAGSSTAAAHPIAVLAARSPRGNAVVPPPPFLALAGSSGRGGRSAPRRLKRQIRVPRSGEPSTPPCAENRPGLPPPFAPCRSPPTRRSAKPASKSDACLA